MPKPPHNLRGQRQPLPQQPQTHTQQVSVRQQWSGPLPPPEALEKFNAIIPNGAERIFAMSEKEQAHRIDYEKRGLTASIVEARIGQIVAVVICVGAIAGSIYLGSIGAWVVGLALLSIPLLGLVKAFMRPRQK